MSIVRPEELAEVILQELQAYTEEVAESIRKDVKETARECVRQIRLRSPASSGEYRKGWKYKVVYESAEDIRVVVYNSKKPQLAHLLEFGHAKKEGGRVEGVPHILPAERQAERQLLNKVKVSVRHR